LISILTEGRTSAQEPKGTLQSDFLIGEESRDVPSNKFLEVFNKMFSDEFKSRVGRRIGDNLRLSIKYADSQDAKDFGRCLRK
jgi:hypothetical protein